LESSRRSQAPALRQAAASAPHAPPADESPTATVVVSTAPPSGGDLDGAASASVAAASLLRLAAGKVLGPVAGRVQAGFADPGAALRTARNIAAALPSAAVCVAGGQGSEELSVHSAQRAGSHSGVPRGCAVCTDEMVVAAARQGYAVELAPGTMLDGRPLFAYWPKEEGAKEERLGMSQLSMRGLPGVCL